jgi:hypothetical protein
MQNFTFKRKIITKLEHWYHSLCSGMKDYQDIDRFVKCSWSAKHAQTRQPTFLWHPKAYYRQRCTKIEISFF